MTAALRVLDPGLAATLQDSGRPGYQRFGVPVSGALDCVSLAIANIVAGNPSGMAAIEILGAGLVLQVEAPRVKVALAGTVAAFALESEKASARISPFRSVVALRGDVLRIAAPKDGAVCYLAVEGGFDLAPALGSVSTYRRAALGGLSGRALAAGDLLHLRLDEAPDAPPVAIDLTVAAPRSLRVMRGPNADYFKAGAFETLVTAAYTVSPASDRMGLRLQGPPLGREQEGELPSQGMTPGGLQVPSGGQPIMLLADCGTTGGYPRIATVIGADIAAAGRLAAGMTVGFEEVSRDEAVRLLREQRAWLASLPSLLKPAPMDALSVERLLSQNLIGGVTAGGGEG